MPFGLENRFLTGGVTRYCVSPLYGISSESPFPNPDCRSLCWYSRAAFARGTLPAAFVGVVRARKAAGFVSCCSYQQTENPQPLGAPPTGSFSGGVLPLFWARPAELMGNRSRPALVGGVGTPCETSQSGVFSVVAVDVWSGSQ